jgi:AcrR family transcriptional regulator
MSAYRPSVEASDITARIIEEATCLFVASGYCGISMREIAEAVGISKAGLYYHFRDKEDLFLAILTLIRHRRENHCALCRANAAVAQINGDRSMSPDQRPSSGWPVKRWCT